MFKNQSFTHRLDKEAWHVGYDIDEEDCSQHHHKSLGERNCTEDLNITPYFFCPSLILLSDADSLVVLLHLFHLERGSVLLKDFISFTLK